MPSLQVPAVNPLPKVGQVSGEPQCQGLAARRTWPRDRCAAFCLGRWMHRGGALMPTTQPPTLILSVYTWGALDGSRITGSAAKTLWGVAHGTA